MENFFLFLSFELPPVSLQMMEKEPGEGVCGSVSGSILATESRTDKGSSFFCSARLNPLVSHQVMESNRAEESAGHPLRLYFST
jgi:hypothetical protein